MADEHARLSIGGQDLEVVSLDGSEGVSQLFRFEIVCRGPAGGLSPASAVGQAATLVLFDSFALSRSVTGVVAEVGNLHHDDGSVTTRIDFRPTAFLLTLGSNCRAFVDQSVVEIVDQVLGGVPHRWELGGSYPKREYTQQYREDDWTFLVRELEDEGIYFWFDHAADSQLVLSDDSTAAPELAGGAYIEFSLERGMTADGERIEQLGEGASLAPGKFTVGSFNPRMPELKIQGAAGEGALEAYDAPGGGPDSPAAAARVAEHLAQGSAAAAAGVSGQASSVRIVPGMVLQVGNHPLGRLDGRYFVKSATMRVRQRRRVQATAERPYCCWFDAMPAAATFRPLHLSPPARQSGLQSGVVGGPPGQEIYPNDMGQVRVQLHWDREGSRDDRSGKWMRVAQRGTHDSYLVPRIGWNVLTFNDEGAVDAPNVLSRIHDAEHPAAYKLPDNMTRVVFKTATSPANGTFNEIYFEDNKGAEEMFINASRDETILAQHVKNEQVVRDALHVVGNDHQLTVDRETDELVHHDQSVSVGADDKLEVEGGFTAEIGGNQSISVGGKYTLESGANYGITVVGARSVSVGAAIVDTSLGEIAADSNFLTILVGGAHLRLSAKSITEDVGGVSIQTIGGAKLEYCKKNRSLDVKKQFLETVGGLLMLQTDGPYTDGSVKVTSWTVGGKLAGKAPKILIEGHEKVTIQCGQSSLVVTKDSIEFTAPKFDLTKAGHIETKTGKIEHN